MRQNEYLWSIGLKTLVCHGRGSNPSTPTHEAGALTTRPPQQFIKQNGLCGCMII